MTLAEMRLDALVMGQVALPSTPQALRDKLEELENVLRYCDEPEVVTLHVIHAGMYARKVTIPPQMIMTGTLIKRATIVIVSGSGYVLAGDEWMEFDGYFLLPASADRKQVFVSRSALHITMIFPTQAQSVEEAEAEFTDECDRLLSRKQDANTILITGE